MSNATPPLLILQYKKEKIDNLTLHVYISFNFHYNVIYMERIYISQSSLLLGNPNLNSSKLLIQVGDCIVDKI